MDCLRAMPSNKPRVPKKALRCCTAFIEVLHEGARKPELVRRINHALVEDIPVYHSAPFDVPNVPTHRFYRDPTDDPSWPGFPPGARCFGWFCSSSSPQLN